MLFNKKYLFLISFLFLILGFVQACHCGDGSINVDGEECDDGNLLNGDGCSSECLIEPLCDHDIAVRYSYFNSFETGIAIEDENNLWIEGNPANLKGEIYSIKYFIDNLKETEDNIHVILKIDNDIILEYDKLTNNYHSMETSFDALQICGFHTISVNVESDGEECNLEDNYASRDIYVDCSPIPPTSICGDNSINVIGEECDDGNLLNGDGCSSSCEIEKPIIIPKIDPENPSCKESLEICSEVINYSEIVSMTLNCEAGNTIIVKDLPKTEKGYCSSLSNVTLKAVDGLEISCVISLETKKSFVEEEIFVKYDCPTCGDGIVERGEICDNGENNNVLCSAGYEEFCEYCTDECLIEEIIGPYCGDGELNLIYEECDDGNDLDNDTCSSKCLIEASICGNSYLEENETCDNGILNGVLCSAGYEEFCEYCTDECLIEEIIGPYCGDGICNNGEDSNSCSRDCDEEKKSTKDSNLMQESCIPIWKCSQWSSCENNIQSRSCVDIEECQPSSGKPSENKACGLIELSKEEKVRFFERFWAWIKTLF